MKPTVGPHALFYPFHLCHQETLDRLLMRFRAVHFRDFMALQWTPLSGLTAFPDRMGDSNPDLVLVGRIVQGHHVSGPLPPDVASAVDRDLNDQAWRTLFHSTLQNDPRFRRGLFQSGVDHPLGNDRLASAPFSVSRIRRLLVQVAPHRNAVDVDYGMALAKTSAALAYTTRLAHAHGLQAATDSAAHFALYELSRRRDGDAIPNHLLLREGY